MAIRAVDVDVQSIVQQHCRQPDQLRQWISVEAKNVLPANSKVKENQLFGFAVVPQGDVDLGDSLEMPEYSFLNHLTHTNKIFKFADDCLLNAFEKKNETTCNLLLYKLDEAVDAENGMLIVKQKKILPCGMFVYKYCPGRSDQNPIGYSTEEIPDSGPKSENVQDLTADTDLASTVVPQTFREGAQVVSTEVNVVDVSPSVISSHPEFGRVINIEPQDPNVESEATTGESHSPDTKSSVPDVVAEYKKSVLNKTPSKRKKDGDMGTSFGHIETCGKKRKYCETGEGLNSLGPSTTVKDVLDMGAGFPGWKRFGVNDALDDDLRTDALQPLSERFSEKNGNKGTDENDMQMQSRVEREALDKGLLTEEVENRKEAPQIQVHVSVDQMRYEKMGVPPPPPMPQSLIDRNSKTDRDDAETKVPSIFEKAFASPNSISEMSNDILSHFQKKFKGQKGGIQYLRKTLKSEMAQSEEGEKKFLEIKKTLKSWKQKSATGKIDESTKQNILAVTQYVQEILQRKISGQQDRASEEVSDMVVGALSTEPIDNGECSDGMINVTYMDTVSGSNIEEHVCESKSDIQFEAEKSGANCQDLESKTEIVSKFGSLEEKKDSILEKSCTENSQPLDPKCAEMAKIEQNECSKSDVNNKARSKNISRHKSRKRTNSIEMKKSSETIDKCAVMSKSKSNGAREDSETVTKNTVKQDTATENNVMAAVAERRQPVELATNDVIYHRSPIDNPGRDSLSGNEDAFALDAAALLEELYDNRFESGKTGDSAERQGKVEHAEGGEADMSLDESFEMETTNILLDSGVGYGAPAPTVEPPPLPEGPPPEEQISTEAQGKLLLNVLEKTRSKEFQERLKSAIGVLSSETYENKSPLPNVDEQPQSLQHQRLSQWENLQPEKTRHGSGGKLSYFQDAHSEYPGGQVHLKVQDGTNRRRDSSDSHSHEGTKSSKGGDNTKTTKPNTIGQFHGRTLLMGKAVPPRNVPLEPLYLTKPYTSTGKKQVYPTDPRPKYYTNGGFEKRIIKQMEEEAKHMIRKSMKKCKTGFESQGVDSGFKVDIIDFDLVNPCHSPSETDDSQKESICSINTIGAELQKRIETQVQVAFHKLASDGRTSRKVENKLFDSSSGHEVENRGPILPEPTTVATRSESAGLSDSWEEKNPLGEDLFRNARREQRRREAERQLQEVEKRLNEIRGGSGNGMDKEDGEVSDEHEVQHSKRRKCKKKSKHKHAELCGDSVQAKSSEDAVDPWEAPFQESDSHDPVHFDPWSAPPEDTGGYVDEFNSRDLFRSYSHDGQSHSSRHGVSGVCSRSQRSHSPKYPRRRSSVDDEVYSRSHRSKSPSLSWRRSKSPLHSRKHRRRSKSPGHRQNRSRTPEGRRCIKSRSPERRRRLRSRSPDYRRSSSRQEHFEKHRGESPHHKVGGYSRNLDKRLGRSPSASLLYDPWREKDDRNAGHESDDELTFLGITKVSSIGKENVPNPER